VSVGDEALESLDAFVVVARDRLRPALLAWCGPTLGEDALQEAIAYACEHWDRVRRMRNPYGYLYRVGQSAVRRRRELPIGFPQVEAVAPASGVDHRLPGALLGLSAKQRVAVVLHVGLGWTLDEVAEVMKLSRSSVRNHVQRGMEKLRRSLADAPDD
jgi:RNA polymerase sigma factor (sigma-70 family)